MRLISERVDCEGYVYKFDGWHLDCGEEDYGKLLRCKCCKALFSLRDCKRECVTGYRDDEVAADMYELSCPKCHERLGIIDERDPKYTILGKCPFLELTGNAEWEKG